MVKYNSDISFLNSEELSLEQWSNIVNTVKQGDLGIEVNMYSKVIEQWSQHKQFWSWLCSEEYVKDI